MSYSIKGTTITLTRGDTFIAQIELTDPDGNPYTPVDGDAITFAAKRSFADAATLIFKPVPIDTMKLILEPEDTKPLDFGQYVYDIQIVRATGEVDTFITKAKLIITEEVH